MKSLKLLGLILPVLLLGAGCFGGSSSPTGPSSPGGGSTGTFSGPVGHLDVAGSGAAVYGPTFQPTDLNVIEIGDARGLQYFSDDEWALMVFFNAATLTVTSVSTGRLTAAGDDYGWQLDEGPGEPVAGMSVHADGSEWVVRFHRAEVPAVHGTSDAIELHGELRADR